MKRDRLSRWRGTRSAAVHWSTFGTHAIFGVLVAGTVMILACAVRGADATEDLPSTTSPDQVNQVMGAVFKASLTYEPFWILFAAVAVTWILVAMRPSFRLLMRTKVSNKAHELLYEKVDPALRRMRKLAASPELTGDPAARDLFEESVTQRNAIVTASLALEARGVPEEVRLEREASIASAGEVVIAAARMMDDLHAEVTARLQEKAAMDLAPDVLPLHTDRLQEVMIQAEERLASERGARRELQEG